MAMHIPGTKRAIMMALTTPVAVAKAVHWEVLCLLLVMIVDIVANSSKAVDLPGLVVVPLIEVQTAVVGSLCHVHIHDKGNNS